MKFHLHFIKWEHLFTSELEFFFLAELCCCNSCYIVLFPLQVLERIMNVEGAELEILIGLCAQICKVIPEEFVQELEGGQIKKRFMKRLVDALNANMNPGGHCSGIRRVIIELSIYMMECNSHYANCFNELRMMEALSMVEEMPSRAENYTIFLGDVGFMEYSIPLIALVDRAKELMGQQCLQGVSSAN
jgi:hypothetical protein